MTLPPVQFLYRLDSVAELAGAQPTLLTRRHADLDRLHLDRICRRLLAANAEPHIDLKMTRVIQ
jgi:hypothetical protein